MSSGADVFLTYLAVCLSHVHCAMQARAASANNPQMEAGLVSLKGLMAEATAMQSTAAQRQRQELQK